jgi:hypothetical protein
MGVILLGGPAGRAPALEGRVLGLLAVGCCPVASPPKTRPKKNGNGANLGFEATLRVAADQLRAFRASSIRPWL